MGNFKERKKLFSTREGVNIEQKYLQLVYAKTLKKGINVLSKKKFLFSKLVRILPGIDRQHYHYTNAAPITYVHSRASNNDKHPFE